MAVVSDKPAASSPPEGPAPRRALGVAGGALGLLRRFLSLREGSIIVVILVTFAYFAITAQKRSLSG